LASVLDRQLIQTTNVVTVCVCDHDAAQSDVSSIDLLPDAAERTGRSRVDQREAIILANQAALENAPVDKLGELIGDAVDSHA
jgi:hypothetical protein